MFALTRFIVLTLALSAGLAHAAPMPSSSSLDHRAVDLDLNHVVIGTVTPSPIVAANATSPSDMQSTDLLYHLTVLRGEPVSINLYSYASTLS